LDVRHVRYVGDLDKQVKRVAVLGGSGEKYIHKAKQLGADAYITGDVTFHQAQDAKDNGLALIDAGHYIEQVMKEATKRFIEERFPSLNVYVSNVNTDPFQFL